MNEKKNYDQDELLQSRGQQQIRELVADLPEDSLSMAWRSSLNERLLQTAPVKRTKQPFSWLMKPAFSLAMAGALAMVVLLNLNGTGAPSQVQSSNGVLEAAIVRDHRNSSAFADVVGVGMNPLEAVPVSRSTYDPGWSEADIESL